MQLFNRERASWLMGQQGVGLVLASSKPSVAVADIRRKKRAMYDAIGRPPLVPYTGHGVGRVVHEPPYLALNDPTVLEPGMSVTLEPHIVYSGDGDIFVGMEDHFLITSDGAEWLTESAPMELYV